MCVMLCRLLKTSRCGARYYNTISRSGIVSSRVGAKRFSHAMYSASKVLYCTHKLWGGSWNPCVVVAATPGTLVNILMVVVPLTSRCSRLFWQQWPPNLKKVWVGYEQCIREGLVVAVCAKANFGAQSVACGHQRYGTCSLLSVVGAT